MVYQGPSRGCQACRTRRIKCDETVPSCNNCLKRKRLCPGYKDPFDVLHKDETALVPEKIRRKEAAQERKQAREHDERSLITYHDLPRDTELESLCFFLSHYVTVLRDPQTSSFMQFLLPLYSRAGQDSPFTLAMSAVAINISSMWSRQGSDTPLATGAYGRAMVRTKAAINDPTQNKTDELLAAVLLLDFYESVSGRFTNRATGGAHQDGATALVKYRGSVNFKDDTSKRLLSIVRTRLVTRALERNEEVPADDTIWSDDGDTPSKPIEALDRMTAILANLQAQLFSWSSGRSRSSSSDGDTDSYHSGQNSKSMVEGILRQLLSLEASLAKWPETVPRGWLPTSIPLEMIAPSIQTAGLYGSHCEVFPVLSVAMLFNNYRCKRVRALQLIETCKGILHTESIVALSVSEDYTAVRIQVLIDDICASVPYHLGDRTDVSQPNQHMTVEYPPLPVSLAETDSEAVFVDALGQPAQMTMAEHARSAAATGGILLLQALLPVVQAASPAWDAPLNGSSPLPIRQGQLMWIFGQLRRIQNIYLLPKAAAP